MTCYLNYLFILPIKCFPCDLVKQGHSKKMLIFPVFPLAVCMSFSLPISRVDFPYFFYSNTSPLSILWLIIIFKTMLFLLLIMCMWVSLCAHVYIGAVPVDGRTEFHHTLKVESQKAVSFLEWVLGIELRPPYCRAGTDLRSSLLGPYYWLVQAMFINLSFVRRFCISCYLTSLLNSHFFWE